MSRLRGREVYIIVAVVGVAICLLWYFFLYSPLQSKLQTKDDEYQAAQSQFSALQQQAHRYEEYKKTAPQAEASLIRMNKLITADGAQPGFIVEIQKTAKQAGLFWGLLQPAVTTTTGVGFNVQTLSLGFDGRYFDVEDFLYRLENYVDYRNAQFLVTGRMFAVTQLVLGSGADPYPDLNATVTINGYQWVPPGAGTATTTGAP
jgi:hypothetical protein